VRTRITRDVLDPARLIAEVQSVSHGAIATFIGTVRDTNDGRPVTSLEYTAYETMAGRELECIAGEAVTRFSTADVVAEHRLGPLQLGEISVIVTVAHLHRAQAFDACRYVIEELKRRVPIWKREQYADGTREWVDPTRPELPTAHAPSTPRPG